jgi:hypothetical protein
MLFDLHNDFCIIFSDYKRLGVHFDLANGATYTNQWFLRSGIFVILMEREPMLSDLRDSFLHI